MYQQTVLVCAHIFVRTEVRVRQLMCDCVRTHVCKTTDGRNCYGFRILLAIQCMCSRSYVVCIVGAAKPPHKYKQFIYQISEEEECGCESSVYGCCQDGLTNAEGPLFKGCAIVPQPQCHLPPVAGPCHNYTAMWFYDVGYGGCSRFWYGGKPI